MARWRERVQVQGVEHVLDAPAHRRRVDAEVLHGVSELVLDRVRHEGGVAVLAHIADGIGQVAGAVLLGAAPVNRHRAAETAAGEVRHETVDAAQQGRLPRAGGADREGEMTLLDVEGHVRERRDHGTGIGDRDAVEADHATASWSLGRPRADVGAMTDGNAASRTPARALIGTAGSASG